MSPPNTKKPGSIYSRILQSLEDAPLSAVKIGLRWTAVVVEREGDLSCGLSSTLDGPHTHTGEPQIPAPGMLDRKSGLELAEWILSEIPLRRSLGCAAVNALLPRQPGNYRAGNAEQIILEYGAGKKTVLVGHFPFVENLRKNLSQLCVLDLNPTGEDLPASAAPEVLPGADLVAITGMTFINHSLEDLLGLCRPEAMIILLGPSTPLSPLLADYGVDFLAGAVVEDVPAVLSALTQGANFRQLHQAGVQLITQQITPEGADEIPGD